MTRTCPHCGAANPPNARFCMNCRTPFAQATALQQPTQIASTAIARPPLATIGDQEILRRATQAFGNTVKQAMVEMIYPAGDPNQHEQTAFICDVSGSMGENYEAFKTKLQAAKDSQTTMIRQKIRIDPSDEVALIKFDDSAECVLPMTPLGSNEGQIIAAVQSLQVEGGTDLNAGLEIARDAVFNWKGGGVVRRIVLLTDGNGGDPIRTATELKSRGVVIDCIGIGPEPSGVNEVMLRKVASVVAGQIRYRFIKDSQTLIRHYTQLAGKTRIA